MSSIVNVKTNLIDLNPHRRIGRYPYVEEKLEALTRSYNDVGMWEGVIARRVNGRYQLAFGHHRVEAARRLRLKEIPLIVRSLDDKQMLQFMGRENLEDYNADFLVMLETWEAAEKYDEKSRARARSVIDTAKLLGWTALDKRDGERANDTAKACAKASEVILKGALSRGQLKGVNVRAAYEICIESGKLIDEVEKREESGRITKRQAEAAKRHVGKAAALTAKRVSAGDLSTRAIKGEIAVQTDHLAKVKRDDKPELERLARSVARQISNVLDEQSMVAAILTDIVKIHARVESQEEVQAIEHLRYELEQLAERARTWAKKLGAGKVVQLRRA